MAFREVIKGESRRGPKARRLEGFVLPPLADLFPFEYQGGGYFRKRGVPTGISADMLHGEQAVQFLYDEIKRQNAESEG